MSLFPLRARSSKVRCAVAPSGTLSTNVVSTRSPSSFCTILRPSSWRVVQPASPVGPIYTHAAFIFSDPPPCEPLPPPPQAERREPEPRAPRVRPAPARKRRRVTRSRLGFVMLYLLEGMELLEPFLEGDEGQVGRAHVEHHAGTEGR